MEGNVLEEIMDISKLKVPDLKKELKARGLSSSGNKHELMERLQSALKTKMDDTASAESVDDLDEDLLNDDDLDHEQIDGSESVLTDLDAHLDVNVSQSEKQQKRKLSDGKLSNNGHNQAKAKKVVLKRNSSAVDELSNEENSNEKSEGKEKKILKLSELTAKERLEMRAKKFGVPLSEEARKTARAQRFGGSSNTNMAVLSGQNDTVSLEALKKRADRFGGSVSTVMSKLEMQERLEKRKERFGIVTTVNGSTTQSEKAKQRLERFKTPIT